MLELTYKHPRTGKRTRIRQAVRIARLQPFECGMLRHPLFLSWGI
jgi:hypothetical protein